MICDQQHNSSLPITGRSINCDYIDNVHACLVIIFDSPSGIMNNISLSLDNTAVPRRNRWNVGGGALSISQGQAGFALVAIKVL